ncbi:DUF1839 family protein [Rhodococcus sp. X156]|uniref:DUF1839 family protein n=1 Tax=Rhodococcus sp. X156 TaxID=2499145 RepID=UPI000FDB8DC5|nr:DUF1839 family protein [Rhodococcus sp. X156]
MSPATAPDLRLLPLDADTYRCHRLHAGERAWSETSCYVDLWVELLHALGHDPVPALASVLSADHDGAQWTFLKPAPEDLRRLYGIDVDELNVWRSVLEHVVQALGQGRLLTVEVDSWWLPDTVGTTYRTEHGKTTVVANRVDTAGQVLEYFHNAGYHRLAGEDFRGLFHLDGTDPRVLVPYVEQLRLDRVHPPEPVQVRAVVREHLARRPERNPVAALGTSVRRDLQWLTGGGLELFHRWAFGGLRQCGAGAELAADLTTYLGAEVGVAGLEAAVESFHAVATGAKSVQFRLARAARGRTVSVDAELDAMAAHWAAATTTLAEQV